MASKGGLLMNKEYVMYANELRSFFGGLWEVVKCSRISGKCCTTVTLQNKTLNWRVTKREFYDA